MTPIAKTLTFEEYAELDSTNWAEMGLPEGRCEYADGELVGVPSESELNNWIAN
jgi:hypothetical protein